MSHTYDYSELMDVLLDFGETMMFAGGEIGRIEDSLGRLGTVYGAVKTNVFVITSSIELTLSFSDGTSLTRTRRITTGGNTDFEKLRKLNALSRQCVANCLPIQEFHQKVSEISEITMSRYKFYLGGAIAAGSFSLFFGGSFADAILSGIFSLLISYMQEKLARLCPNKIFFLFMSSLIAGTGICLTAHYFPGLHIDKIIIGDIMLLVPGIAITNAVRDTIIGDTISGITKLADSLVWAAALAAGFMVAILGFAG